MPIITLREGDFGSGVPATFSGEELVLPDPERPGLKLLTPLSDIVEMESIETDPADRLKNAAKLSVRGFALAGPIGVARGVFAATKVHEVVFKAVMEGGRRFVAVTDAGTYAEMHAAQIAARFAKFAKGMPTAADDLIAKYINAQEPEGAPIEPPPPPEVDHKPSVRDGTRPVFGRRGR